MLHICIKQSQVKGPIDLYDPCNFDESFAQEYGGYGDGRAGGSVGGSIRNSGPRGPERGMKIPTMVRDVPRPLSPPRHHGYRESSYEHNLRSSLIQINQPVRGHGPGPRYYIITLHTFSFY